MKTTIIRIVALASLSFCTSHLLAAEPAAPPPPRPGLFLEEVWKQVPKGGENVLSQSNVGNASLELKLYGPKSDQLQETGFDGNDTNPTHTWTGLCGAGCTFALRNKKSFADFSKGARIMVQSKTSGFHKIHPFIKLADGKTYVGDKELGQTADFLFEEFRIEQVKWLAFDTELGVTKGNLTSELDLGKVDEIGFTDLMPGSGHGPGGWSDVGVIRVYANAVPR